LKMPIINLIYTERKCFTYINLIALLQRQITVLNERRFPYGLTCRIVPYKEWPGLR